MTLNYRQLLEQYGSSWNIPYADLLQTQEWQSLRTKLLEEANHKCCMCKRTATIREHGQDYRLLTPEEQANSQEMMVTDLTGDGELIAIMQTPAIYMEPVEKPVILHVHHTYYVFGQEPWNYPTNSFMVLCHECHSEVHETIVIPVFVDESQNERLPLTPCTRCNGTGFMRAYHYYQNGICFRCLGRKFEQYLNPKL